MTEGPGSRKGARKKHSILPWILALLVLMAGAWALWWYWQPKRHAKETGRVEPSHQVMKKTRPDRQSMNSALPGESGPGEDQRPYDRGEDRPQAPPRKGTEEPARPFERAESRPRSPGAGSQIVTGRVPKGTYPTVSPETSQKERKEAFGLNKSVDHVVQVHEPFIVHEKEWTIDEIRKRLGSRAPIQMGEGERPVPHPEEEKVAGRLAGEPGVEARPRRSVSPPEYYGIHVVRAGENVWNIHYGILREYFARRGIHLPLNADEPSPRGQSSAIGRLLKFLEGIVYVYNVRENRLVEDINLLYPDDLIVFFKISDVFAALDGLKPQELRSLRYVGTTLGMGHKSSFQPLLDQRKFRQEGW